MHGRFLCDTAKSELPKRSYYMACLYRFEKVSQVSDIQTIADTVFNTSIVPIGEKEVLAVIGMDLHQNEGYYAKKNIGENACK